MQLEESGRVDDWLLTAAVIAAALHIGQLFSMAIGIAIYIDWPPSHSIAIYIGQLFSMAIGIAIHIRLFHVIGNH